MLAGIEDVVFVARSIEDLYQVADSVAEEIQAVRGLRAGELRNALLDALHDVEHIIRVRATELADILQPEPEISDEELETLLRRQDIVSHGVLYR